jgi:exoribonuclease-2
VPSYAWSTSPLRRYTDLVNQWQLIACVRHGATAALVAPFKPKDAELFGIISGFETAYAAYNTHQSSMERFWTLQHLQQQAISELDATVFKSFPGEPPMARAQALPLVFSVSGAPPLERGGQVRVRITAMDLIALDVHAQYLHTLDAAEPVQEAEEEDEVSAGPLHIAVDLSETATEEPQA